MRPGVSFLVLGSIVLSSGCGDPTLPEIGEVGVWTDKMLPGVLEQIRVIHEVPALGAITARIIPDTTPNAPDTLRPYFDSAVAGFRVGMDGDTVTVDDLWHLGSLTKSMTATLAGRLVDRGIVLWDTTVAAVFPELIGTMREEYENVRLDSLLYHTSRLPTDVTQTPSWPDLRTSTLPVIEQRRAWIEELLALEPAPGEGHLYTNAGYVVAGAMLEQITGQVWEDLMHDEIFVPLRMAGAGFGAPGNAGVVDQPRGHEYVGEAWVPVEPGPDADNPAALGPAGTVHATLMDLGNYLLEHLNGIRNASDFVDVVTWRKLHTAAPGAGYALGWGVDERNWANGRVLAHSGSNTLWFAVVWIAPERNLAMAAVVNAGGINDGGEKAEAAADQVIRALILRSRLSL